MHISWQNRPIRHLAVARLLLANGADVAFRNHNQVTALHLALKKEHLEVARLLLASGADVASTDNNQETALHLISKYVKFGNVEVASLLLARGGRYGCQKQQPANTYALCHKIRTP